MLAALEEPSSAQTVIAAVLGDFSKYLSAAAKLMTSAVTALNSADTSQIPNNDRDKAATELRAISKSIVLLRVKQRVLIEDLSDYTTSVRKRGFASPDDRETWDLEPVTHFVENKAVLYKYLWASRLGCRRKQSRARPVTRAMSAMRSGRFAPPI